MFLDRTWHVVPPVLAIHLWWLLMVWPGYLIMLFQLQQLFSVKWCKIIIIGRTWRIVNESVVAYLKVVFLNLSEATEENHEQLVQAVIWPEFDLGTLWIHTTSSAVSANVLAWRSYKTCGYLISILCFLNSEFQAGTICSGCMCGRGTCRRLCSEMVHNVFPFILLLFLHIWLSFHLVSCNSCWADKHILNSSYVCGYNIALYSYLFLISSTLFLWSNVCCDALTFMVHYDVLGRMLPVLTLVVPTVMFGLLRYLFTIMVRGVVYQVMHFSHRHEQEKQVRSLALHYQHPIKMSLLISIIRAYIFLIGNFDQ
jgi:hypothetical protein